MKLPLRVVQGEWQNDPAFQDAIRTPVTLIPAPSLKDADLAPLIRDADVLLCKSFTAGLASSAGQLRLILTPGAGTNWIDFEAVPDHIAVCNVFSHEVAIAEHVFMSILALNADLIAMHGRFKTGDWSDRKVIAPRQQISGKTLGIVGLGHIGAEVARLGTAFRMRTVGATRRPDNQRAEDLGLGAIYPLSEIAGMVADCDFVVVAVPLEPGTTNLITEREFAAMKPSCRVVNVARGEVINERAFFEALNNQMIAGAAIDVWYRYPERAEQMFPSAFPFHELPNVIMTPHIAGWTVETFAQRWATIDENLRRLAAGEPLINVVKPAHMN